jgi:hypothetical protein
MLKNNTFGVDIKGNNNNLVFKNNTFGVDNKGKVTINWCLKITLLELIIKER